jgi:hypothetical protein
LKGIVRDEAALSLQVAIFYNTSALRALAGCQKMAAKQRKKLLFAADNPSRI